MKQTFTLANAWKRKQAVSAVLVAEIGDVVEIKAPTRNLEQNALLHALLSDISRQVEWAGKKWDVEDWKRLVTAAWMRTRSQSVAMVPAIDGHGFDVLYQRTSTLSKGEFAELVDFTQAWAADQGVEYEEGNAC